MILWMSERFLAKAGTTKEEKAKAKALVQMEVAFDVGRKAAAQQSVRTRKRFVTCVGKLGIRRDVV